MNLYLMRHGETDWNKEGRMQGQCNTSLNEYGRELARITKEAIKDLNFDYVFSSPLERSLETARIVLEGRNIEIVTDDRLKEISFGEYEGLTKDKRPENFLDFFKAPDKYVPAKGAESYENLCNRTRDFIDTVIIPLSYEKPSANVFIFGHGAMNKSLLLYFKKLEIKDIWSGPFQKNCCISNIEIKDGQFKIIYENKIFYEEKENKVRWKVKAIYDDDRGCEERDNIENFYIVYFENEDGEKKELRLSDSFINENEILEGRFIEEDLLTSGNNFLK